MDRSDKESIVKRLSRDLVRNILNLQNIPNFEELGENRSNLKLPTAEKVLQWSMKVKPETWDKLGKNLNEILCRPSQKILSQFTISDLIGSGTFGIVVEAYRKNKDLQTSQVALKFISLNLEKITAARNEYDLQSFASKANPSVGFEVFQILNDLSAFQKNVFDFWKANGWKFIDTPHSQILRRGIRDFFSVLVMQKVQGTLDKLFSREEIFVNMEDWEKISETVVTLLRNCNRHKIVHFDAKANNVGYTICDASDTFCVKFIDWGKSFNDESLKRLRIPSHKRDALIQYGHKHDCISLYMSCLRNQQRNKHNTTLTQLLINSLEKYMVEEIDERLKTPFSSATEHKDKQSMLEKIRAKLNRKIYGTMMDYRSKHIATTLRNSN